MKNRKDRKYVIAAGLLIVASFLLLGFLKRSENVPAKADVEVERDARKINTIVSSLRGRNLKKSNRQEARFVAKALGEKPVEPKDVIYPPFKTGGGVGGRFTIRNQAGDLIRRGTKESPVVAITISPNEKLIWVSGGDVKSYIINRKGEEVANLSIVPPGKDMLGFSKWVWIDNNRLLGESGVQKYDENGKLVACCGGDNVSESRFYVYDLRTNQMDEMSIPENLREKVVRIGRILKTGEFQLGHEGDKFEWYKVAELKQDNDVK